jgi:hypothetical protein
MRHAAVILQAGRRAVAHEWQPAPRMNPHGVFGEGSGRPVVLQAIVDAHPYKYPRHRIFHLQA